MTIATTAEWESVMQAEDPAERAGVESARSPHWATNGAMTLTERRVAGLMAKVLADKHPGTRWTVTKSLLEGDH